ncbi:MAG: hypothetical protein ACRD18_03990 [Terriglobia bacterium]
MTTTSNDGSQSICLKTAAAPHPAEAYTLPVSGFPMQAPEIERAGHFLAALSASMTQEWSASAGVFIQFNQLHLADGARRFGSNAPKWKPKLGLGVWPDREPPTLWTTEEFQKLQPGEKMRPMNYKVFQIRAPGSMPGHARDTMLGLGTVVEVVTAGSTDALLDQTRNLFLPFLKEPIFRSYKFYLPLLDRKSLEAASAAASAGATARDGRLEEWLCGATAYIRESAEDQAILIVSLRPLAPIFARLLGKLEQSPEPEWRFPY